MATKKEAMTFGPISMTLLALTIAWVLVMVVYRHVMCKHWRKPEHNRRYAVVPVTVERRRYCKACGAEVTAET